MKLAKLLFALVAVLIIGSSFSTTNRGGMEKLMKKMMGYIKAEKKQIEEGKPPLSFPVTIEQMNKASVTKGKKLAQGHQGYVEQFFADQQAYAQAKDSTERKGAFNVMVNSCIGCHQHECPGPVNVIKKNLLQ